MTTKEMEKCIKAGHVNSEIAKHLSRLEVTNRDDEESFTIATEEQSDTEAKCSEKLNSTDVSWSVNVQTARRISNLPHFSNFLKNLEES